MPCSYVNKGLRERSHAPLCLSVSCRWAMTGLCLVPCMSFGGMDGWGEAAVHEWESRAATRPGMLQAHVEIPETSISEEHSMWLEQVLVRARKIQDINDYVTPLYLEINKPDSTQGTNKPISPSRFKALFPSQDLTSIKIRRL